MTEQMDETKHISTDTSAEEAMEEVLQFKSRKIYEQQYDTFIRWCNERQLKDYTEDVLMRYFTEKPKSVCASTLWAHYSMLKSMLNIKNNIDISKYHKLVSYLKRQSDGYKSKKSKTLTAEQVDQFLTEAPDDEYLMIKVALILGVAGACRGNELLELSINDVTDLDCALLFKIRTKTKHDRSFVVRNPENNFVNFVELCKKYMAMRKPETPHSRFFVHFINKKCTSQPVGKNTFGKLPQKIAAYLNLPDASSYTGHCFRRTSASLLADCGASVDVLRRHGGWKSSTVPRVMLKSYHQ